MNTVATDSDQMPDPRAAEPLHASVAHHIMVAAYLDGWANALACESNGRTAPIDESDFILGYQRALRDLAGHLRTGDALPGSPFFADLERAS